MWVDLKNESIYRRLDKDWDIATAKEMQVVGSFDASFNTIMDEITLSLPSFCTFERNERNLRSSSVKRTVPPGDQQILWGDFLVLASDPAPRWHRHPVKNEWNMELDFKYSFDQWLPIEHCPVDLHD
jgi:hypothetical protein